MYDGYLTFGGNEVVNNDRARGYAQTADCPMFWFKGPTCPGLRRLIEPDAQATTYEWADIEDAPWYDPVLPDLSSRFYGSFGIAFNSFMDSTRQASKTEGIDDGGVIGRTRKAMREVQVTTVLAGKGRDAIDYGMGWLSAALDPGACGQHGSECGTADLAFLADCPGTPQDYTKTEYDVTTLRKNLAFNPQAVGDPPEAGGVPFWSASGGFEVGQIEGFAGAPKAAQAARVATGAARVAVQVGEYTASADYIVTASLRASEPMVVTASLRPDDSSATGEGSSVALPVPAGESVQTFLIHTTATAPGAVPSLSFATPDGIVESTLDITNVLLVRSAAPVWTESRRNYFRDPNGGGGAVAATWNVDGATIAPVTDGAEYTVTSATTRIGPKATLPRPGVVCSVRIEMLSSVSRTMTMRYRPVSGVSTSAQVLIGDISLEAGVPAVFEGTFTTLSSSGTGGGVFNISTTMVVGATLRMTKPLVVALPETGDYFDGSTVPTDPYHRYSWTGAVNGSESIEETTPEPEPGEFFDGDSDAFGQITYEWAGAVGGSVSSEVQTIPTQVLDPDAYAAAMRGIERFLHGVGAISGPTVTAEYEAGEFNAYVVEFVLDAETPWVFSALRELALTPSLPVTVQDTPYNLVPYPAAELAGPNIIVSRNFATNPSVETNATGITGTATMLTGAAPAAYYTTGRVTELAAVGTASFRQRILGAGISPGVPASTARLIASQTVPLTGYVAGQRLSFSVWTAALISAGAGVSLINAMSASVEWLNGSTPISTQVLGTVPADQFGGYVIAASSLLPPAGATNARVFTTADVTWGSSATANINSDIRIYTDALLVSVP